MKRALRVLAVLCVLALAWPEVARYRAEHGLKETAARVDRVLRGLDAGASAQQSLARAGEIATTLAPTLPGDSRPALLLGIVRILQQRGAEAVTVFEAAIAQGERPELTLNLGRARTTLGDTAGADAAYLRTAWASSRALDTLPAAMRTSLLSRVDSLDAELRAGRLQAPPP